jgi:hypothetical protein
VAAGEQSEKMMTLVSDARRHDLDMGLYVIGHFNCSQWRAELSSRG